MQDREQTILCFIVNDNKYKNKIKQKDCIKKTGK